MASTRVLFSLQEGAAFVSHDAEIPSNQTKPGDKILVNRFAMAGDMQLLTHPDLLRLYVDVPGGQTEAREKVPSGEHVVELVRL